MAASHETIVFSRILAKPSEALTLLDRIDKIRPRGPGHRILLISMKGLAGNGLLPTPSVVEQTLKESPDLEQGQRREGLRKLVECLGRSTPSVDDTELSVRALLDKERRRILRGAVSKAEAALSEENVGDAEAAIMDTAASLAELDLESQSTSAERVPKAELKSPKRSIPAAPRSSLMLLLTSGRGLVNSPLMVVPISSTSSAASSKAAMANSTGSITPSCTARRAESPVLRARFVEIRLAVGSVPVIASMILRWENELWTRPT